MTERVPEKVFWTGFGVILAGTDFDAATPFLHAFPDTLDFRGGKWE